MTSRPRPTTGKRTARLLRIAVPLLVLALAFCGKSPTEPGSTPMSRTAIHLVATTACAAPERSFPVFLDGKAAATLSVPGEVTIPTTPGGHTVQIESLDRPAVDVSVTAGTTVTAKLVYSFGCAS
jgi:hypothetical protein